MTQDHSRIVGIPPWLFMLAGVWSQFTLYGYDRYDRPIYVDAGFSGMSAQITRTQMVTTFRLLAPAPGQYSITFIADTYRTTRGITAF